VDIQAVIFDMGGVLIEYDGEAELDALAALCTDPAWAKRQLPSLCTDSDLATGRFTIEDLHRMMAEQLGATPDRAAYLCA
jgi:hypothetical protein